MSFSITEARKIALQYSDDQGDEAGLADAFAQICGFLHDHPESLSWPRRATRPVEFDAAVLQQLARKYFDGYRKSDFPATPGTIPDSAVSLVMLEVFGYAEADIERIKLEHQRAMSAENCVGALLERYIDSVLRPHGWCWCCGSFVKAVDFIQRDSDENWLVLQIKNRDNSENSSSSAIRKGTSIQKWFRTYSRKSATNWENVPSIRTGLHTELECQPYPGTSAMPVD